MSLQHPSSLALLVLIPLLMWRLYSRVRRLVGRQKLSRVRPWLTLLLMPLLLLALATGARHEALRVAVLGLGVVGGAVLGRYGLSRTRFEATPQGLFYTPNAHLGIALSLLVAGRILWRVLEITLLDPTAPRDMGHFARSPLTLAVFGLLAGYYVIYAAGLVRWRAALPASATEPPR